MRPNCPLGERNLEVLLLPHYSVHFVLCIVLLEAKQHKSMMLLPPCLTAGTVFPRFKNCHSFKHISCYYGKIVQSFSCLINKTFLQKAFALSMWLKVSALEHGLLFCTFSVGDDVKLASL